MRRILNIVVTLILALGINFTFLPAASAVQPETLAKLPIASFQAGPLQPVTVEVKSLDKSPTPVARFIQGTRSISPNFDRAVNLVLDGFASALPPIPYYAITDVRRQGGLSFVSVIGLANLAPDLNWTLDNGVWFGLLLLVASGDGRWQGALQGTSAFTALLASVPDTVLAPETKKSLDPLLRLNEPTTYIFPWEPGTSMEYVSGVHLNGFNDKLPGWLAVDFLSDGDTRVGHAPNKLLAAAASTIDFICNPGSGQKTAAIKVGDLMYTHLVNGSNLYQGRTLAQGEVIGTLQAGSFSETCGVARQPNDEFHVHLGFPATATLQIEGWTLNLTDHKWYRDGEVREVKSWLVAGEASSAPDRSADALGGVAGGGQEPQMVTGWAGTPLLSQRADALWIGRGCVVRLAPG
jgi:hypothetical protein